MTSNPLSAQKQLAVFVGGGTEALAVVEAVLEGRSYDVEFVDADDEPYATIAALKPDMVVVNLELDELWGFQLLTMLRLDPMTVNIPVLSYVRDEDLAALGRLARVEPNPATLPAMLLSRAQRH